MTSYRIYIVEPTGRLQLGGTLECRNDAAAVEEAGRRLAPGQAGELWSGGRIVGRFSKLGVFTPAAEA